MDENHELEAVNPVDNAAKPKPRKKRGILVIAVLLIIIGLIIIGIYFFPTFVKESIQGDFLKVDKSKISEKDTLEKENVDTFVSNKKPERIEENELKGKTVIAFGSEVEQGEIIDSNPRDCKYVLVYSCDVFENGCDDEGILDFCSKECLATKGTRTLGSGMKLYDSERKVTAVLCECNNCNY